MNIPFPSLSYFILIVLLASNLWLVYRVLNPLRRLSRRAANLARGDFTSLQQPCGGIPEIGALQRSLASMAGHLRRTQQQSRTYADLLTSGQEAERARIARELHDDTVQSLVAIAQGIELARNWIASDPARASSVLDTARQQAVDSVTALRSLIGDLRPPALEELGLITALKMQAQRTNDLKVSLIVEGVERRLAEAHELTLFRCAQEALANAARHSRATAVEIKVVYQPDQTSLIVSDNGQGFVPPDDLADLAGWGHYGLLGIQERVQRLHGALHISGGSGTRLEVTLPVNADQQPPQTVRDPVCSAVIEPHQAYGSVEYKGQRYYFCCPVCQGAFQREPEVYLRSEVGEAT